MTDAFTRKLLRRVIIVTAVFVLIIGTVILLINNMLPGYIQAEYIQKSRTLAQTISRTIQDVRIFSGSEKMIRRMVQLNFPEERNIVNIVVRDQRGQTMFESSGSKEGVRFSEILKKRQETTEVPLSDERTKIIKVRNNNRNFTYYKITAPIIRNGIKTGEVVVGLSKKTLTDKIEINQGQLSQIIFMGSMGMLALLSLSFLISMWLFVMFKKSQSKVDYLSRLAYVGEISSGLAHEIRNPLNTMSLNIQLLRENIQSGNREKLLKKVDILEKAKNQAAVTLDKFLDFAKHRQGSPRKISFQSVVNEVLAMLQEKLKHDGIDVSVKRSDETFFVHVDPNEITQILLNLLLNAMQSFSSQEERLIKLEYQEKKEDLLLSVEDNGDGMDEFTVNHIYTPFFSKKATGTGLGMAVVKKIIEEYNGSIMCYSKLGKGTKFELLFKGVVCH